MEIQSSWSFNLSGFYVPRDAFRKT